MSFIEPPPKMKVPDDLKNQPSSILPGAITYVHDGEFDPKPRRLKTLQDIAAQQPWPKR